MRPEGLTAPLSSREAAASTPRIAAGSAKAAITSVRGAQSIIDYITNLIGSSWWEIKGKDRLSSSSSSSHLRLGMDASDDNASFLRNDDPRSICMDQFSFLSELVMLLRCLMSSLYWRDYICNSFKNSLAVLPSLFLRNEAQEESPHVDEGGGKETSLLQIPQSIFSLLWKEKRNELYTSIAAVYVMGGFVDAPRVGGKVSLHLANEFIGRDCRVVGYDSAKNEGVVLVQPRRGLDQTSQTLDNTMPATDDDKEKDDGVMIRLPFSELIAIEEIAFTSSGGGEIGRESLTTLLNFLKIDYAHIKAHSKSKGTSNEDLETQFLFTHFRARFLKAFAALLSNEENAILVLKEDVLLSTLQTACKEIGMLCHKLDASSSSGENAVTASLTTRLAQHSSVMDLELLSVAIWRRIRKMAASSSNSMNDSHSPRLIGMGGDVQINGYRVRGIGNFPTVKLADYLLPVNSGKWYYEVVLLTDGLMQIGWADTLYSGDPVRGCGIGDHNHSYAFDGYRMKKWNHESDNYGLRWHIGDIIGCFIDMNDLTIEFSINGEKQGIAFADFDVAGGMFPAVSLNMGQAMQFNFGQVDFIHPPVDEAYKAVIDLSVSQKAAASPGVYSRLHQNSNRTPQSTDGTSLSTHEEGLDGGEEDNTCGDDVSLQRQVLIDNLINMNMGFPVDLCVRAAHNDSVGLNGDLAISW